MDAAVGRILDALDAAGEAANTLVVFTTDHGIAFPRAKATLYDPGLHVSLIVRGPGVVAPGRAARAVTSHVDLFPTFAEAAQTQPAQDIQGRSLMPLLRGEIDAFREAVFGEKNTHPTDLKRCIRTEGWKYIRNYCEGPLLQLPTDIEVTATRRDLGDAHLAPRPKAELYDLTADPLEQNNLAGQNAHAETEADLAARLDRFLEATNDPIRIDGTVPRPTTELPARARAFSEEAMAARRDRERALQEAYQCAVETDTGASG
jgi:arylsulfatase A-like enzyme